jgi:hypothetical protein
VGIEDPATLAAALSAAAAIGSAVFKLAKIKIQADRDTRIAEMAFRDSKPSDRGQILDGLAKLRPFHPGSSESLDESAETATPGMIDKLSRTLRRKPR